MAIHWQTICNRGPHAGNFALASAARVADDGGSMRLSAFIPLCAITFATGCGNLHNLRVKAAQKKAAAEVDELVKASGNEASQRLGTLAVGEVEKVSADDGFALVKLRTGTTIAANTELATRKGPSGKVSGLLRITPERRGSFVAADIVSGTPEAGDSVTPSLSQKRPALTEIGGPPTPAPAGQAAPPSGVINVDPGLIKPEDLPTSTLDLPAPKPR
jgi:hypothetical protein